MTNWERIKTAPKDGTEILGARFNCSLRRYEMAVIKWTGDTWMVVPTKDGRLSHMASHWVPLPDDPVETRSVTDPTYQKDVLDSINEAFGFVEEETSDAQRESETPETD